MRDLTVEVKTMNLTVEVKKMNVPQSGHNCRSQSDLEADDESSDSHSNVKMGKKKKKGSLKKHRKDEQNELMVCSLFMSTLPLMSIPFPQRDVGAHARQLMGREEAEDPIPLDVVPSPQEVKYYDPKLHGRACTVDRFRVDLNGTAKTPWNTSAGKVFAKDFLDCDQYACADRDKVERAFWTHFKTLREHWRRDQGLLDKTRKVQKARDERKRGVSLMCLSILTTLNACDSYTTGA